MTGAGVVIVLSIFSEARASRVANGQKGNAGFSKNVKKSSTLTFEDIRLVLVLVLIILLVIKNI
jgi:hypothetical protein